MFKISEGISSAGGLTIRKYNISLLENTFVNVVITVAQQELKT
jgi:hypothetical protein